MNLRVLPNALSVARLLASPVVVWLIGEGMLTIAFWVFLAAVVTDAADGLLAKWLDARTELGSYLDPLADKALLVSVYVMFGVKGYVAGWLVILVVFRDLAIVGGAVLRKLLAGDLRMRPLLISKINTVAQILLAVLILGVLGPGADVNVAVVAMIYAVTGTTILSGLAYLATWSRYGEGGS
ncbi:MAG: CDP-alcohol phosphatidyltransferase family protein [Alphaproteobacteria bacterium]|nr:CDP-alcohol phosphatidyltransferase family protein [Alphaproteobacteria bacterium]MBF0130875.1 CDP-alcohol phosphatidyltransferase family protein [Alphaproteobacteria bacterium]